MSKAITQNRNESELNGKRDEISRSTEELNSIEGDLNLTESKFNQNNSLVNLTKPSSDSELIESSILMIANGNLKWQKNFEELRLAVDRLQLQSSKGWTSPGGYCKLFESGEVSIRWYSNSKTLTVKGEKADEIKEKLLNFDRKLSGEVKVYSESPKVANILESTDRNLHLRSRNCSVNNEMTRTNGQSYSINTNDANYNKSPEFYEINSKLENYSQNVTRKLDALAEEISTIKENKENAAYGILILEETVNDLKKEKYELNRENEDLKEKNKNLFQALSEVRAKVIELQDEKSSLITALKLIQRELVSLAEKRKLKTWNLRTRI
ncbi:Hypothetical predicted protein [Paramuricea clavata]|uniref:Uncharacterized protein n=1 Tax=Paramuricea clavata TaxID=317549 RepID=A0A6S7JM58_PARCT|nr:Hypothetical predicted protein [Paramuricea clavata]CAB4033585.1 Hypothetical predicted protein [Paramuricea clavata]